MSWGEWTDIVASHGVGKNPVTLERDVDRLGYMSINHHKEIMKVLLCLPTPHVLHDGEGAVSSNVLDLHPSSCVPNVCLSILEGPTSNSS